MQALHSQQLTPTPPERPLGPFDRIDRSGLCAAPGPIDSFDLTMRY
jgi:hypothetical protein